MLAAAGLAAAAGAALPKPTGHRPQDDDYDESQHTGGRRHYESEPAECESESRDDRPEWQKIGDRKGRSRPNKSRR
ncbi:hypothetical protein [Xanthomonas phage RTH11]|nr:hypothetical protein [Xanthomonas phage RTH11]